LRLPQIITFAAMATQGLLGAVNKLIPQAGPAEPVVQSYSQLSPGHLNHDWPRGAKEEVSVPLVTGLSKANHTEVVQYIEPH